MTTGGDLLLKTLSETRGIVSKYVSHFISNTDIEPSEIVDNWFSSRIQMYFDQPLHTEVTSIDLTALDVVGQVTNPKKIKLVSIKLNYFRGFRTLEKPINLQGGLVVLDGRNSSGKTSLAEAIEWLLVGHISRRDSGDPKELSQYITNRFKPEDENTWVELVFELDGEIQVVKRVLLRDYDSKKNSNCESQILHNNVDQEALDSSYLVDQLFSGVAPLLMQHTLRLFVLDSPDKRRDYFEQLLSLDRITLLIEKSVVGDARFDDFPNKSGSTMLAEWSGLKSATTNKNLFGSVEHADETQMKDTLQEVLIHIAVEEFKLDSQLPYSRIVESIQTQQRLVRQSSFPLLEVLRPKRTLDEALLSQLTIANYDSLINRLQVGRSNFQTAVDAAKTISESQIAISKSLQNLRDAGLILDTVENQVCPLCEYQDIPTLARQRIIEISAWDPARTAVWTARQSYQQVLDDTMRVFKELQTLRGDLLPRSISDQQWSSAESFTNPLIILQIRRFLDEIDEELHEFDLLLNDSLGIAVALESNDIDLQTNLQQIAAFLPRIVDHARTYAGRFSDFESYIDVMASEDKQYSTRGLWLKIAENSEVLLSDLRWEIAKKKTQKELSGIRDTLMSARQQYLETRRIDFSNGISDVWGKLRTDSYAVFNKLFIPEPRGKGFPVKIEVKAMLANNTETYEVDALSIFSESQINVVGIAAFVTRSKLMGHSCLVFDDPVQSMDEEHFKTFANNLLKHLCDDGFQIIVLTHSDTFARDISYAHSDRLDYVTMKIVHSKRKGCLVEEGNRRVVERLDQAMTYAEDGNLQQAWICVRFAIERLYIVVQIKYGHSDFNPSTWANHTAEAMWNESVGAILVRHVPESAARLREILDMTAGGAHDKYPNGSTDLNNAVNDIKPLLNKLRVGG